MFLPLYYRKNMTIATCFPDDPRPAFVEFSLVKAAVQNPFLESVRNIAELTGVSVSKRSLEEILPDAARDFDAF